MEINRQAPAVAADEIEIAAPAETVWDILADINHWPDWNPAIWQAALHGDLTPGTVFRWKAGPGTLTSTLQAVQPPTLLGWTGKTMGINAIHIYQLEEHNGITRVRTAESWEGPVVRVLRGRMQHMLASALVSGLQALKAEAERRAARGQGDTSTP